MKRKNIITKHLEELGYPYNDLCVNLIQKEWEHDHQEQLEEDEFFEIDKEDINLYWCSITNELLNPNKVTARVDIWYQNLFPTDELAEKVARVTFEEIYNKMVNGEDFYDIIGVMDSIVRERIFSGMVNAKGISYDELYDIWRNTCD